MNGGLSRAWARFRRLHIGLQLVVGFFVAMTLIGAVSAPADEPTEVTVAQAQSDADLPRASTTTEYVPREITTTEAPTTTTEYVAPTTAPPTTRPAPVTTRPPVTATPREEPSS